MRVNPILLTRPGMEDVPGARRASAACRACCAAPLARGGFRRVPALAPAAGISSCGIQARGRRDCGSSDAANQLLIPGYSLHEEMGSWSRRLTPLEAITAATRRGASCCMPIHSACCARQSRRPRRAQRQPTTNIAATRNIALVMIRGRIIRPDP